MVGIKDFDMPSCCNSCDHWSFHRDDEPLCDLTYEYISQFNKRQDDCPLVEAISKADYEARLKADMVAMLTELKNKLIDKSWNIDMYDDDLDFECCYLNDIDEIIQEKIDKLKEAD